MLPFIISAWQRPLRGLPHALLFIVALSASAAEPTYTASDIVIEDDRIKLEQNATQTIDVTTRVASTRPTLESALANQSNIQVVHSPLKGSNLSLNGLSGEHVCVYWDGDPILGRVDGALDARAVSLGTVDRISIYQGLDSLPYGSQNVAGVISLESPWENERQYQLRSAAGNYSRTMLGAKAADSSATMSYSAAVDTWRGEAVRANPNSIDTDIDALARLSAAATLTRLKTTTIGGEYVDVRAGGSGFQGNTSGVYGGLPTTGQDRRVHVFADARRKQSMLHASYNSSLHEFQGDRLTERALRIGPELKETSGNFTWLAGAVTDVHESQSTRIPRGKDERTSLGAYAGTRYALNETWVVGAGTRYDTGPKLVSPRAEVRALNTVGAARHTTVLETGLGFREPTAKERYHDFVNPALRYHVVGNPELKTEHSWMTALRHTVETKRLKLRGSIFQIRMRDAIGFQSESADSAIHYRNISQTLTHGLEWSGEYRVAGDWKGLMGYQWLRGRDLENDSDLALQPRSRISLGIARDVLMGLAASANATWTGRQGFFDINRNRKIDANEWADSYWMTSVELAYGLKWNGVADPLRVFGRVDNVLDTVRPESLPVEPRTFLVGASVDL